MIDFSGPAQGGLSACAGDGNRGNHGSGANTTVSVSTAASLGALWQQFSANGGGATPSVRATDAYGLVSVHTGPLAVGEKRTLSIVLAWHYPARSYLSDPVGNFYTTLFNSSEHAAASLGVRHLCPGRCRLRTHVDLCGAFSRPRCTTSCTHVQCWGCCSN